MDKVVELFILNDNFEILAIMDDFSPLAWNPRFFGVGEFQVECDISYFETIQNATYIMRAGDKEAGVIDMDSLQKDEVGGRSIVFKGKFLKQLLDDRAVHEQTDFNNKTVEDIILGLIKTHFIDSKRFKRFKVLYTNEASNKITTQITGGSVLERIVKIEEEQQVSCKVEYDFINDEIVCSVVVGENRSQDQEVNNWVVFSEDLENVYDYEYTKQRYYKNYAYVAGAGEGKDRKIVLVDIRKPGDPLKELYVDARDLQPTNDQGNPIPEAQYLDNLRQRGHEKLAEYAVIEEIEAKVKTNDILQYKKDYFLGDIVDFVDNSKGLQATLRITGVNEEIEGGERKLELIFGKERLSLKEIIRREVN